MAYNYRYQILNGLWSIYIYIYILVLLTKTTFLKDLHISWYVFLIFIFLTVSELYKKTPTK